MQHRGHEFDARAYDPWTNQREDRDLSDPDRDAVWTAAHPQRASTVAEWLMGLASLACLVAMLLLGTQHVWRPWLGVWDR